jgi:hypothetical protein
MGLERYRFLTCVVSAWQVLMQMRTNVALLTEIGALPSRNPSMEHTEDARVASLISLEDILKQAEVHSCSTSALSLGCDHQSCTKGTFMETSIECFFFMISDIFMFVGEITQAICNDAPQSGTTANKKLSYLRHLDVLEERMNTLLFIDQPCAQKCILDTRKFVEVSNAISNTRILTMHSYEPLSVQILLSKVVDGYI